MKYEDVKLGMQVKAVAGVGAGKMVGEVVEKSRGMPTLAGTISPPVVIIKFGECESACFAKRAEDIEPMEIN